MKERSSKRVKQRKEIILKDEERCFPAVVTSISRNGLSAECEHVFPAFKEIDILIHINNKPVSLKGSVRWINENPGRQKNNLKEAGIAIKDPPEDFIKYYEGIAR